MSRKQKKKRVLFTLPVSPLLLATEEYNDGVQPFIPSHLYGLGSHGPAIHEVGPGTRLARRSCRLILCAKTSTVARNTGHGVLGAAPQIGIPGAATPPPHYQATHSGVVLAVHWHWVTLLRFHLLAVGQGISVAIVAVTMAIANHANQHRASRTTSTSCTHWTTNPAF